MPTPHLESRLQAIFSILLGLGLAAVFQVEGRSYFLGEGRLATS